MIIFIAIFGLSVGSFVNAMVYRMIREENFVSERSKCDHCEHKLAWFDLLPVFSWLSSGGKCRYCSKKLSATHIVFEIFSAAVFVLFYIAWSGPLTGTDLAIFVIWQIILVMLLGLLLYDLREFILPDSYLVVILASALIIQLLESNLVSAVIGAILGGGFFHLLHEISNGKWIGFGDVKMGYVVGFLLGPTKVAVGTILGFYIAAAYVLPLLVTKVLNRKSRIPFGPFLIAGYYLSYLFSDKITDWFSVIYI